MYILHMHTYIYILYSPKRFPSFHMFSPNPLSKSAVTGPRNRPRRPSVSDFLGAEMLGTSEAKIETSCFESHWNLAKIVFSIFWIAMMYSRGKPYYKSLKRKTVSEIVPYVGENCRKKMVCLWHGVCLTETGFKYVLIDFRLSLKSHIFFICRCMSNIVKPFTLVSQFLWWTAIDWWIARLVAWFWRKILIQSRNSA